MPRLKFDLKPVDRNEEHYQTREENDEWVRERWARFPGEGEPAPCDCGYYGDGWLVSCDASQRIYCRVNLIKRLEYGPRQDHLRGLRKKREFPGPPHDGKGVGWCRWCGFEIINPKTGKRHHLRTWCADGGCFRLYSLHTFHGAQSRFLEERDGLGCKKCSGPHCQVDHIIPLAAAWEAFPEPERRRWFFSPSNLQLLCGICHPAKSRDDVAFIKVCQQNGTTWAKAEILQRLADVGLLRITK